jgi:hypothetical protein
LSALNFEIVNTDIVGAFRIQVKPDSFFVLVPLAMNVSEEDESSELRFGI